MKAIGITLAAIAAAALLLFGLPWISLKLRAYFGPESARIERDIFEHTPSFLRGKEQILTKMRGEWERSEPDARETLKMLIRHEAASIDITLLNPELQRFITSL